MRHSNWTIKECRPGGVSRSRVVDGIVLILCQGDTSVCSRWNNSSKLPYQWLCTPYDVTVKPITDAIRWFFHVEHRPWEGTADTQCTCCWHTMSSPVPFRRYLQEALCADNTRPSVHRYQQLNLSYDFHEVRCTNSLKTKEVEYASVR